MDYSVTITKKDWPMILALAELQGNVAPPSALADAIRFVHGEAGGADVELGSAGLSMMQWTTAELFASATWISSVLTEHDNIVVRSFAAWTLRCILLEMSCRIAEREPPKPAKPSRPSGPMN